MLTLEDLYYRSLGMYYSEIVETNRIMARTKMEESMRGEEDVKDSAPLWLSWGVDLEGEEEDVVAVQPAGRQPVGSLPDEKRVACPTVLPKTCPASWVAFSTTTSCS